MADASSRILVDRTTLRLDGRPFFSIGPRILLTPPERYREVLGEIAAAGFTVVGSPPCSPGVLPMIDTFFDRAEEAGLLVVLIADPRLPEHGRYMADRFRRRASLHSYLLPPRPSTDEGFRTAVRDRDSIRAQDLFHPIWAPLHADQFEEKWLRAQDIYSPVLRRDEIARGRVQPPRAGQSMRALARNGRKGILRPLFCADLPTFTSDEERRLGIYADDPWVSRLSPRALEWFPYLANFVNTPRRDMLAPSPDLLRLQVYDLLTSHTRGLLLDFYEAMSGSAHPFTGRDRFAEATILAQEIAVFQDFFAEGRAEPIEIESGHPRLGATVIRHGHDLLVALRMEGYEDDYFIDEAYMERTEITVRVEDSDEVKVWRMDFPEARPLELVRDAAGAVRFLAGPLELTGLLMITHGTQRSHELADQLADRLPRVAKAAVEILSTRFAKVALIEGELRQIDAGVNNRERLMVVQRALEETRQALAAGDHADAYNRARAGGRLLRQVIKYQMARALATPLIDTSGVRGHLRSSYFTLPRFYQETSGDQARAFSDLT